MVKNKQDPPGYRGFPPGGNDFSKKKDPLPGGKTPVATVDTHIHGGSSKRSGNMSIGTRSKLMRNDVIIIFGFPFFLFGCFFAWRVSIVTLLGVY